MNAVLVDLHLVRHAHHRGKFHSELVLGRANLVMVLLDLDTHLGHGAEHLAAHVLRGVLRRHREIALLEADVMAEIAAFIVRVGVDRQLHRIELEAGVVRAGRVFHVVEDEELGLGPEIDRIADAQALDQAFGLSGDRARIAGVGLAGQRLQRIADQDHRRFREERVDAGALGVGHELHVGLVDRLPAGDGGAVEHDAFAEGVLVDGGDVGSDVLPLAARVGKPKIDVFHVVVLDHLQGIFGRSHGMHSLSRNRAPCSEVPRDRRFRWRPARIPPF